MNKWWLNFLFDTFFMLLFSLIYLNAEGMGFLCAKKLFFLATIANLGYPQKYSNCHIFMKKSQKVQ